MVWKSEDPEMNEEKNTTARNEFDPKNPRVRQARQKKLLNNPLMVTLAIVVFIALVAGGIALLVLKSVWGWTLLGFAAWPLMFVYWV